MYAYVRKNLRNLKFAGKTIDKTMIMRMTLRSKGIFN